MCCCCQQGGTPNGAEVTLQDVPESVRLELIQYVAAFAAACAAEIENDIERTGGEMVARCVADWAAGDWPSSVVIE
jgi:hypothetical protein